MKNISSMETEAPFLVIGAGPAGSACAWKLASEGRPVVLADRCRFPRQKLCGGALSNYGADLLTERGMLLPAEVEDLVAARHNTFSCYDSLAHLRTFYGGTREMRLLNRSEFDSFLCRRAVEAGAVFLEGHGFRGFGDDGEAVFAGGERVRFQRMVGADGADSAVRRRAYGRPRGRHGLCLETFVPLSPGVLERFLHQGLQIHFGLLPYGYGWVFPRREDVCVGVGSFGPGSRPKVLTKAAERLIAHLGLGYQRPMRGALIPPCGGGLLAGKDRVLLVGDAAGLCDRVSGEGISHALESGFLAAEALISGTPSWDTRARCVRQVRDSGRYRHLLYAGPFHALAMKKLREGDRFMRIYWEIAAGESRYSALLQRRPARMPSAT
ncbi:MAG: NAD(P)/FAD-dependent oxidoreductase [Candidatus Fermentibacteraceae bacterium]